MAGVPAMVDRRQRNNELVRDFLLRIENNAYIINQVADRFVKRAIATEILSWPPRWFASAINAAAA